MKRVGILIVGICFVLTSGAPAHAWFGSKKKETPAETAAPAPAAKKQQPPPAKAEAAAPQIDKALEKTLKDKREAVQKKMALLNNTEWQIEMLPLSGKGKKELETVTFKNNQVTLTNFFKKGFPQTNITLTVQEDGTVIWETMQTSEKAGICFWRGELDKAMTTMRGVLSHKIDEKTKMDYSFSSTGRRALPADK
jgi:hypothetical protein